MRVASNKTASSTVASAFDVCAEYGQHHGRACEGACCRMSALPVAAARDVTSCSKNTKTPHVVQELTALAVVALCKHCQTKCDGLSRAPCVGLEFRSWWPHVDRPAVVQRPYHKQQWDDAGCAAEYRGPTATADVPDRICTSSAALGDTVPAAESASVAGAQLWPCIVRQQHFLLACL